MKCNNFFLGIIGGMGPRVLLTFCNKIINKNIVKKEQEHIPFIAISDPSIEDRTDAILDGEIDKILIKLNKLINGLVCGNITHLIMLCNTVHFWIPYLNLQNIKIINIIQLTSNHVKLNSFYDKILLLATKGTYKTQIYYNYFDKDKLIIPDSQYKDDIMNIIYNCKIGKEKLSSLSLLIKKLKDKYNFNGIILGCTELSILLEDTDKIYNIDIIDPIEISAQYVIKINNN